MTDVAVPNNGLAAMLMQWAPKIRSTIERINPLLDQPVIRMPYQMPNATSLIVAAGATGARIPDSNYAHSLEWPFEVNKVKFSQDPAHTFRDWSVMITDQSFSQQLMKAASMVDLLVEDDTGVWTWDFPWIVRPKGGGFTVAVNNLDTVNPISVDVSFEGYLLIPRA